MHIISYPVRGLVLYSMYIILYPVRGFVLYCKHIMSYPVRVLYVYTVRVLIIIITYAGCPAVVSGAGPLRRIQRHVGK